MPGNHRRIRQADTGGRRAEARGALCGQFTDLAKKTAITYHVAKLREAGVVNVTPEGTRRRVRLRRTDLDARFPGFLDSIIASTKGLELDGFEDEDESELSRRKA